MILTATESALLRSYDKLGPAPTDPYLIEPFISIHNQGFLAPLEGTRFRWYLTALGYEALWKQETLDSERELQNHAQLQTTPRR